MLQTLPTLSLPAPRSRVLAGAWAAAVALHLLLAWSLMAKSPVLPLGLQAKAITASVLLTAAKPEPTSAQPPAMPRKPAARTGKAMPGAPTAGTATPHPVSGFSWQYLLIQGERQGTARLNWRPDEEGHYEALLERELEGKALPAWRSQGDLDAEAGLSPRRFAQRQLGKQGVRDRQATNFRRDEGVISFSASPALLPLQEGAQDRISWWLQLAALVDAEPQRYQPGIELVMPVASLRGELQQWHFKVKGLEALDLPAGRIEQLLRLERQALGPMDARIELWLDPSRHHLPVRVRHTQGDVLRWELLLQSGEKPLLP